MTVREIAEKLRGTVALDSAANITDFYCGDFLSRVMHKAQAGCGWLTIVGNLNVAGVAVLADIPLVILCEDARADDALVDRLRQEGIALVKTELPVFECCVRLAEQKGI